MIRICLHLCIASFVNCLTSVEISQFGTPNNYTGAFVTVDSSSSDRHLIYASGLPDHEMTNIPSNPNRAETQNYNISITKSPSIRNGHHGCVPMGMIGITRTGVAIFNPLNAESENAVEGDTQETFDSCGGHADNMGIYHYHKIPDSCLYRGKVDEFIGVALDGFPIYGPNASDINHLITSDDLDECHGREVNGEYRYHATFTWPYYIGCFKGTVLQTLRNFEYNCNVTTASGWEDQWTWFLCNCGAGGGPTNPDDCRPDNPNRPNTCDDMPDCMNTDNPPMICYEMCRMRRPPPPFCQNLPMLSTTTRNPIFTSTTGNSLEVEGDKACSLTYNVLAILILLFICTLI